MYQEHVGHPPAHQLPKANSAKSGCTAATTSRALGQCRENEFRRFRDSRPSSHALRTSWVGSVVAELQKIAGREWVIDTDVARGGLIRSVSKLPRPTTHIERLFLRGLLLDFAWRFGAMFHIRFHHDRIGPCPFGASTYLEQFWKDSPGDPRRLFVEWTNAFFDAFDGVHPSTPARRAAKLIRRDCHGPWSMSTLAAEVHTTPSTLSRTFRREYGASPKDYQRLLRLLEALRNLRTTKIEAIALHVGYKSKKNFYRAFQQLTGRTPGTFQKLSHVEAMALIESTQLSLARMENSTVLI